MKKLIVIPDEVADVLRVRAASERKSFEALIREILAREAGVERGQKEPGIPEKKEDYLEGL